LRYNRRVEQKIDKADPTPELRRLVELAAKYPEVGPPLAELAAKLGQTEISDRVIRMGLDGDSPGVEFHFVLAHSARREKRYADALDCVVEALRSFSHAAADKVDDEDGNRLLHLVRLGFATLMFEIGNFDAHPEFAARMTELLPGLEPRMGKDPFYRTLLAQTYWFRDREKSEAEWDAATQLDDTELSWNARGTWYREAEKNNHRAETAYRTGLRAMPESPLLLHNVAQILVDRASDSRIEPQLARKLLGEADDLLRTALRADAPRVRRHIHATRDRLNDLRKKLPRPKRGPRPGPGKDRSGRPAKPRRDEFLTKGKVSLGDMILAKLKKQESD